jgi:ferrous iron transport protein A
VEKLALNAARSGSLIKVIEVPDGKSKSQLIRLGIAKGEVLKCLQRLPGGTVVVEHKRKEIAIGSALARGILVTYC